MSYEPLHHKYRPQTFAQLVGQEAIATTLSNALRQQRIAPAYLFTGPRGTGKTSSARILAKSLNCSQSTVPTDTPCGTCEICKMIAKGAALDVIEIDAASNTGVDNIRELIERAQFAPVQCRYKVYIIDEVHMLSTAAFNALLKTLEEPPARVVFVLATTDPQRVLPTIISRCQRFDYRRIPLGPMVDHLTAIAQKEAIDVSPDAVELVAQIAQGGLRDAESLLDQLSLLDGQITVERVWDLVGAVPERDLLTLVRAIAQDDGTAVLDQARHLMNRGREPLIVLQNLASFYRDLLIAKTAGDRRDLVTLTQPTWNELCGFAQSISLQTILHGQQHLRESEVQVKNTTQPRLWLEITLMGLLPSTLQNQGVPGYGAGSAAGTPPGHHAPGAPIPSSVPPSPTPPLPTLPQPSLGQGIATQETAPPPTRNGAKRPAAPPPAPESAPQSPVPSHSRQEPPEPPRDFHAAPLPTPPSPETPPAPDAPAPSSSPDEPPVPSGAGHIPDTSSSGSVSPAQPSPSPTPLADSPGYAAFHQENLNQLWNTVLANITRLGTQALLQQYGCLLGFDGRIARVGIKTKNLMGIAQSKQSDIEEAFQKTKGTKVVVSLEVGSLADRSAAPSDSPPSSLPPTASEQPAPSFLPEEPSPNTEPSSAQEPQSPGTPSKRASSQAGAPPELPPESDVAPTFSQAGQSSPSASPRDAIAHPPAATPPAAAPLEAASTPTPSSGSWHEDEVTRAAKSLAQMFNGAIVNLDDDLEVLPASPPLDVSSSDSGLPKQSSDGSPDEHEPHENAPQSSRQGHEHGASGLPTEFDAMPHPSSKRPLNMDDVPF